MTKLDLSVGPPADDAKRKEFISAKKPFDKDVFFRMAVKSSASYRAFRFANTQRFLVARLPFNDWDQIELGSVLSKLRAEKMVDWWVQQDERVVAILTAQHKNLPHHETIEDLMIEVARLYPVSLIPESITYTCAQCKGMAGKLYELQYHFDDDQQRRRRATRFCHVACVGLHMLATGPQAFWLTGEFKINEVWIDDTPKPVSDSDEAELAALRAELDEDFDEEIDVVDLLGQQAEESLVAPDQPGHQNGTDPMEASDPQ